ncbi:arylsulfatase B [Elysia marginata]|uniref:Arylsulfatase B n=1 Tax=Elysia marginata TaxID=1093978 RepID=A0AAV4E979_9GAST|nr:arylsulfatase B [Elysia marginata]
MDGMSLWKSITRFSPSPRTEFVYNLDNKAVPEEGHAAIRVEDMKLIVGIPGLYNSWYKPDQSWNEQLPNPDYSDIDDLFKEMLNINPEWNLYRGLFNLSADPTEHVNLYWQQPDLVNKLKKRLAYHISRMVPANYPPYDPASDPKHWGGAWSPGWC